MQDPITSVGIVEQPHGIAPEAENAGQLELKKQETNFSDDFMPTGKRFSMVSEEQKVGGIMDNNEHNERRFSLSSPHGVAK